MGFSAFAADLRILHAKEMDPERYGEILQTLRQSKLSIEELSESELDQATEPSSITQTPLLLPLSWSLSPQTLRSLYHWIDQGGRLVVVPSRETASLQYETLFRKLNIPLTGIAYLPQSTPMVWMPNPAEYAQKSSSRLSESRPLAGLETPLLPVGSRVLLVQPPDTSRVVAKWGESYPAIILGDHGAILNWTWGQELPSEANSRLLRWVLAQISPNPTQAATTTSDHSKNTHNNHNNKDAKLAERFAAIDQVKEDADANHSQNNMPTNQAGPQEPDFGIYFKNMRILDNYKKLVNDAIQTALELYIPMPVKEARQLTLQSDIRKAKFESLYLAGKIDAGLQEFTEAKHLLLKAVILTSPSAKVEGRALWLDRSSIVASGSPDGLRRLIQQIHNTGINIIYFETVNAGFSIYPSRFLRQNPLIQNWDPLQVAVAEGHRLGMEVHAWVWCFAVGNIRHNAIIGLPSSYPGPVLQDKGMLSEALRRQDGGLTEPGQHEYWLSPASYKARHFLKDVYSEIVTKYDVDGLQLDYIRYPFQSIGSMMGFEPAGRDRFYRETGLSLSKMNDVTAKTWAAWKTNQVSAFVRDISHEMKSLKPNLKISAAVFPMSRAERILAIQQDWETWIKNGWIDTLNPMTYTSSGPELQRSVRYVLDESARQAIVYPGIALNHLDPEELIQHLELVRQTGALGTTFFAMAHLDTPKQDALREGPFKETDIIAPHQNPMKALGVLLEDYQDKFNQLQLRHDLDVLPPDTFNNIQSALTTLKQELQDINALPGRKPILRNEFLQLNGLVDVLSNQTVLWMNQDETIHPYRVQYFSELMLEIRYLLTYAKKKLLPSSGTTEGIISHK